MQLSPHPLHPKRRIHAHLFSECFKGLGAEKLEYSNEFINDVRLYHEGFAPLHRKFEDIEIRYLMLSDFYDFMRLTKRYKAKK